MDGSAPVSPPSKPADVARPRPQIQRPGRSLHAGAPGGPTSPSPNGTAFASPVGNSSRNFASETSAGAPMALREPLLLHEAGGAPPTPGAAKQPADVHIVGREQKEKHVHLPLLPHSPQGNRFASGNAAAPLSPTVVPPSPMTSPASPSGHGNHRVHTNTASDFNKPQTGSFSSGASESSTTRKIRKPIAPSSVGGVNSITSAPIGMGLGGGGMGTRLGGNTQSGINVNMISGGFSGTNAGISSPGLNPNGMNSGGGQGGRCSIDIECEHDRRSNMLQTGVMKNFEELFLISRGGFAGGHGGSAASASGAHSSRNLSTAAGGSIVGGDNRSASSRSSSTCLQPSVVFHQGGGGTTGMQQGFGGPAQQQQSKDIVAPGVRIIGGPTPSAGSKQGGGAACTGSTGTAQAGEGATSIGGGSSGGGSSSVGRGATAGGTGPTGSVGQGAGGQQTPNNEQSGSNTRTNSVVSRGHQQQQQHQTQAAANNRILQCLKLYGFDRPTKLQAHCIPAVANVMRNDRSTMKSCVVVQGPAGSGKTSGMALAVAAGLDPKVKHCQALVLCIRERRDFDKFFNLFTCMYPLKLLSLVGVRARDSGSASGTQEEQEQQGDEEDHDGAQVIVGRPGEVLHFLNTVDVCLDYVSILILDDAQDLVVEAEEQDLPRSSQMDEVIRVSHLVECRILARKLRYVLLSQMMSGSASAPGAGADQNNRKVLRMLKSSVMKKKNLFSVMPDLPKTLPQNVKHYVVEAPRSD
eukprot:g12762.t1